MDVIKKKMFFFSFYVFFDVESESEIRFFRPNRETGLKPEKPDLCKIAYNNGGKHGKPGFLGGGSGM